MRAVRQNQTTLESNQSIGCLMGQNYVISIELVVTGEGSSTGLDS